MISKKNLLRLFKSSGYKLSETTLESYVHEQLCSAPFKNVPGFNSKLAFFDDIVIKELKVVKTLMDKTIYSYNIFDVGVARYSYLHKNELTKIRGKITEVSLIKIANKIAPLFKYHEIDSNKLLYAVKDYDELYQTIA